MILYTQEAIEDLRQIRKHDGLEPVLMLLEWCQRLDEPATRITADFLDGANETYRLRVEDYHITFELQESALENAIQIMRVRARIRREN